MFYFSSVIKLLEVKISKAFVYYSYSNCVKVVIKLILVLTAVVNVPCSVVKCRNLLKTKTDNATSTDSL